MGKKNADAVNKNKEKRQARKLEQRRIADGMNYVGAANKLKDLTTLCNDLLLYKNNDLEIQMYIQRVTDLEKCVLEWAIDLTERNMKKLYETCTWGWNKNKKVEEMTEHNAWYLVAKDKNDKLQAFAHFRFDMDHGDPVLYWCLPSSQHPGVYKVDCSCGSSYIGQTKRTTSCRIKEHIKAITKNDPHKSAIATHLLESGPNHWIELHKPQVLSTERHYFPRIVKEAIEIQNHPNFNREDGFRIPSAWNPVIGVCKGASRYMCSTKKEDLVSFVGNDPSVDSGRPKRRRKRVDRFF